VDLVWAFVMGADARVDCYRDQRGLVGENVLMLKVCADVTERLLGVARDGIVL